MHPGKHAACLHAPLSERFASKYKPRFRTEGELVGVRLLRSGQKSEGNGVGGLPVEHFRISVFYAV